jgi:hypothetical protein
MFARSEKRSDSKNVAEMLKSVDFYKGFLS